MNVVAPTALVCLAGLTSQSLAQSSFEGNWCAESDIMFIDAYGIGFNDHTMCDVENLPVAMDQENRWASKVACRNVHVVDVDNDGTEEVIEMPIEGLTTMNFLGADDGTLVMTTDFHMEDLHFLPCDAFN